MHAPHYVIILSVTSTRSVAF